MVEAAMVFPLVILIVAGIITTGLNMYAHVREDSSYHKINAHSERMVQIEDILRGKWTLNHNNHTEEDEDS